MDYRFVKKIIKATEDLDTLVYLSCSSFDTALQKWLTDFTKSLNEVSDIFESFDLSVSAATKPTNFSDRRLESIHKEFLNRITQYVEGVDLAFARKAFQYSKIAIKLHGPKKITTQTLKNIEDAEKYLKEFESAIRRIRKYSNKLLLDVKAKKLESLKSYEYQYTRLALFEKLTLDLAISLLKENAEI